MVLGVVNTEIKKGLGLLLSLPVKNVLKSVNIWQSYKQEVHFVCLANTLIKDKELHDTIHLLARNYAKYSPI